MKKMTVLILSLSIAAGLLCACGAVSQGTGSPGTGSQGTEAVGTGSQGTGSSGTAGTGGASGSVNEKEVSKMVLHEPEYVGPSDINRKPVFRLSWDPYPGAYNYEFGIYVEGEDTYGRGPFAIRSTKGIYSDKASSADLYFLQGIYTDTATYRIKIRPSLKAGERPEDHIWSNLWEIRFVNGEYTVQPTEADFDEEIAAAKAQKEAEKGGSAEGSTEKPEAKPEAKEPLAHTFPEPLLQYLARERGQEEAFSTDNIASLTVSVNYCEYGEPAQFITDEATIEAFKSAVQQISVTGKYDEIFSTETYYYYSAADAEGKTLFSFPVQNGLLEARDGRYSLDGLAELFSVPGIMLEEEWGDFWGEYNSRADDYERGLKPAGMTILDAAGYGTHKMTERAPDSIFYIGAYIDYEKNIPQMKTRDREEIESIYAALSEIKVGKKTDSSGGRMWHMDFGYTDPDYNFSQSTYLSFRGNRVKIGSSYYEVENIDKLYDSSGCEIFAFLKDFSEVPEIKPVY